MLKIFYVEDEAFLAKIVSESLERMNHNVLHLSDGRDITQQFIHYKPDICILDIMLPYKNGYEIAEEIRKVNPSIPIIFLTAKSQTKDLVAGFEAGGNDYIKKPFSMEELQVRMENLISITRGKKEKTQEREVFNLGLFEFHPKKQQLIYKDVTKSLSHKECQILGMLCNHKNGTTGRKEILLNVWGDDSYFNSRNLDVYVRKLRKYLSADPKLKILTLKGVGYHFVVE